MQIMNRRKAMAVMATGPLAAQSGGSFRVALGSIMHESNSFNPAKTELSDFDWVEPSLDRWAAGSTEVAGFIEEGRRQKWTMLPTVYSHAMPRGPVSKAAFEELAKRLVEGFEQVKPFDAILIALHGAMYAEAYPQGDEELIRRLRAKFPKPFPIVLTHDFHGNTSPAIVEMTNVLVSYKQNPHLDTKDRGIQAANILGRMLRGEIKPVQAIIKPDMVYNIVFQNTYGDPMKPLTQETFRMERDNPKILAASVMGGYQYNDSPHMGPSIIVVTDDDRNLAEREAKRLSDLMWAQRDRLKLNLPDAATAVKNAMAAQKFPVALFDIGDNVGGGSAGDSTFLLEQLLAQKADGWVVVLYAPAAFTAAQKAGLDGAFDQLVGGKSDNAHGKPVRVKGKVRSLHAGRYIETAVRHGGGRYWNLGHTAVIEAEGSTRDLANYLVVTSERSSPNSIHQIVSLGIYPERQKILVAKGTIAPRAAYEPVAAEIVMVDTPGATSVNPGRYEFEQARKDLWGIK
jgi:microcystin degradation protein MlrC